MLKTDHGTYAIRYAGMGEVRQALQYYRLNKAQNREQWRAAMRMQALPIDQLHLCRCEGEYRLRL